jgi:hypothetical protein
MQETHDESHELAAPAPAGEARGMDQDTDQVGQLVELRGGGWKNAVGYAREFSVEHACRDENARIVWQSVMFPEFFLNPAAAMLVAQGKLLQDFFPPDVYFRTDGEKRVLSRGPYFFLKGEYAKPNDPPPRLKGLLLARVLEAPCEMKMEELRAWLLQHVR